MAFLPSSFRVDPNNYLSHNYEDYLSEIYAVALSQPTKYFEMRKNVVKAVKRDAIKSLYNTFFEVLTTGRSGGTVLLRNSLDNPIEPRYPEQDVNEVCLSAAATLDKICEDVVNIILPRNINDILSDKLSKQGKSTIA
jgi:hypothetical protein